MKKCDVLIIGGGPAGSMAGLKLLQSGYEVEIIEKVKFPRFVIGESLLPRCNELLEEVNLLDVVKEANFQFKGGVAFENENNDLKVVHFEKNMGQKHNSSFQVRREVFDKLLLDEAVKRGAKLSMESTVIDYNEDENIVLVEHKGGEREEYQAKKVIDASGYGRVLPRLLNLESDASAPMRNAVFCRVENDERPSDGTDGYIYVYVVGDNEAWIWNIPLSETVTSVGIVCSDDYYQTFNTTPHKFFDLMIDKNLHAKKRYASAVKINEVGLISGYSSNVSRMFGKNFVMVGNATEFLDPVFSSGVTLALESGFKAGELTAMELEGKCVDWEKEYEEYMMVGIDVFREYVEAWYDGRLQEILFSKRATSDKVDRKIVSVLSGYVWDKNNMFVHSPKEAVNITHNLLS